MHHCKDSLHNRWWPARSSSGKNEKRVQTNNNEGHQQKNFLLVKHKILMDERETPTPPPPLIPLIPSQVAAQDEGPAPLPTAPQAAKEASEKTKELTDATGRYVRKKRLARGQFKEVYKAFDEEEALEVAWNEINCSNRVIDFAKVKKEVNLLNTLDHPNVIKFYASSWVDEERHCFVFITELMTSGTLKDYIAAQRNKVLKPRIVQKWCRQVLQGLAYLHSQNVMHRDLKCDNIFVNGNKGEIKIGDLGLSVAGVAQARTLTGTPEFMAPEIYDESYTNSVDIWSFGMCALEMATGEYPYSECENVGQVYRKVTKGILPAALGRIPEGTCKEMIQQCLHFDPALRPTAQDLIDTCVFLRIEPNSMNENLSEEGLTSIEVDASATSEAYLLEPLVSETSSLAFLAWVARGPRAIQGALVQLGVVHGVVPRGQYAELEPSLLLQAQQDPPVMALPFTLIQSALPTTKRRESRSMTLEHSMHDKEEKAKASEQRLLDLLDSGFFGPAKAAEATPTFKALPPSVLPQSLTVETLQTVVVTTSHSSSPDKTSFIKNSPQVISSTVNTCGANVEGNGINNGIANDPFAELCEGEKGSGGVLEEKKVSKKEEIDSSSYFF